MSARPLDSVAGAAGFEPNATLFWGDQLRPACSAAPCGKDAGAAAVDPPGSLPDLLLHAVAAARTATRIAHVRLAVGVVRVECICFSFMAVARCARGLW